MLPSAHLTASASGLYVFAAPLPTPPILCLRFAVSLTVAAQDSRPSGSLLLSRKALASSTSCRFSPAHCNRDFATVDLRESALSAIQCCQNNETIPDCPVAHLA